MAVTIRQLTPDDWRVWREVRLAALAEAPEAFGSRLVDWTDAAEKRWRDRLRAVPFNVLAEVDGAAAGQVSGGLPSEPGHPAELISMWVAPHCRGQGVGEALISAVVDWATEHGAEELALTVRVGNEPAARLYRRCGFVDAELAHQLPDEPPERWMRRSLR